MGFHAIPVRRACNLSKIKALYASSFPRDERYPFFLLRLLALRRCAAFLAFYDGPLFCGLAYLFRDGRTIFLLYLATEQALRSLGYGAKILGWMRETYPAYDVTLNIEPEEPGAENGEQRGKRRKFYLKNGFLDTGYAIKEVCYDVLSTSSAFSPEAYQRLLCRAFFGMVKPKLYQKI